MLKIILLSSFLFMSGCNNLYVNQGGHKFPGSTWGIVANVEIISDVMVGKLRVRKLRITNDTCKSTGYKVSIELTGEINKDSVFVINQMLNNTKRCIDKNNNRPIAISIYMNSSGGSLESGIELGRLIRKHQAKTIVSADMICASSCAIAFLGGVYRNVKNEGELQFHAPYVLTDFSSKGYICDRKSSAMLKEYYVDMVGENTGNILINRTMDYCSDTQGWTVNADAASLFGISTK